MEGNCPRCQVRLEIPVSGEYQCERCKTRFEVAVGAPRPPVAPAAAPGALFASSLGQPDSPTPVVSAYGETPSPPELGVQAPCAGHPNNPAAQVCERCGDFMCRLCTTTVEGRAYCPRCFDLLYSRGALSFSQRQFTLPGVTLALGLGALVTSGCLLFGLPLGIAGIVTGFRALKEHRTRPDLPKRGVTLAGLWISGLSMLLSLLGSAAVIWALVRKP